MRQQAAIWILLAVGAALVVVALGRPDLIRGQQGASILYLLLMLAFVGSAMWTRARLDPGSAVRDALIWLAVIVALAGGYRLWESWTGARGLFS
jgi:hypothetical protein